MWDHCLSQVLLICHFGLHLDDPLPLAFNALPEDFELCLAGLQLCSACLELNVLVRPQVLDDFMSEFGMDSFGALTTQGGKMSGGSQGDMPENYEHYANG